MSFTIFNIVSIVIYFVLAGWIGPLVSKNVHNKFLLFFCQLMIAFGGVVVLVSSFYVGKFFD